MKKLILTTFTVFSLISCGIDDNIDPNKPQFEQLTPKDLLANAETSGYDAQTTGIYALANIWTNTWAGNQYYFASPMTREYQLELSTNFYSGIWNSNYKAMANMSAIINNSKAADYPHHVAIAKIMLAKNMQYIVDLYGDAPYSEAFKQQEMLYPKYDKGEDIYKNLVISLNEAISGLSETTNNPVSSSEDVIAHGDLDTWKKIANTIKLRLLLRQSKVNDATISAFVNTQLQSLQGASFVDSDVLINPGYNSSDTSKQSPLYREYGWLIYDDSAQNTYGYRYYMISDHFAKLLNGDASKPTNGTIDPRRTVMYRSVSSTIKGIEQGGPKISGAGESSFSRLRWKFYNYASVNSSMDGYFLTQTESELLQSEAAVLYPQYFSNAQLHYTNAVAASFATLGSTANPNDYLASLDSKSVGWTGSGANKIAAIQYQRLVGLHFFNPIETYINYLKTGYPDTPLALTAVKTNKPYRLLYPSSEYIGNSANVPNINADQCFVKNEYTPFWNRN